MGLWRGVNYVNFESHRGHLESRDSYATRYTLIFVRSITFIKSAVFFWRNYFVMHEYVDLKILTMGTPSLYTLN